MTTRDYLWLTLVVGLGLCLCGRWGWYEEQLRWARIREAMLEKALERKEQAVNVFVVGRIDTEQHPRAWEFCGVFDSEEKAIAACVTDNHFVGPCQMNGDCESGSSWPGSWYPKLQVKPQ